MELVKNILLGMPLKRKVFEILFYNSTNDKKSLYHWSHLELYRYFGISDLIAKNAEEIFHQTNKMATSPEFSCLSLPKKMKVEQVCTTDEPQDNLKYHIEYSKTDHYTKMSPTFRPDKFIHIQM